MASARRSCATSISPIEPQSFQFLTGPSGAGKTTLLQADAAVAEADARHDPAFSARTPSKLDKDEITALRRRIGVVFQDFRLLDHLTTYENVALPLRVMGRGEAGYRAEVVELLRWVGLGERMNALPAVLSGGEKQRAAIARALIVRPELLLADEPTGNVDPGLARRLLRLFVELHKSGTAVVIATHDLAADGSIQRGAPAGRRRRAVANLRGRFPMSAVRLPTAPRRGMPPDTQLKRDMPLVPAEFDRRTGAGHRDRDHDVSRLPDGGRRDPRRQRLAGLARRGVARGHHPDQADARRGYRGASRQSRRGGAKGSGGRRGAGAVKANRNDCSSPGSATASTSSELPIPRLIVVHMQNRSTLDISALARRPRRAGARRQSGRSSSVAGAARRDGQRDRRLRRAVVSSDDFGDDPGDRLRHPRRDGRQSRNHRSAAFCRRGRQLYLAAVPGAFPAPRPQGRPAGRRVGGGCSSSWPRCCRRGGPTRSGGEEIGALFGEFSLGRQGYAAIFVVAIAIAVLTGAMSRIIVFRHLRGLQ